MSKLITGVSTESFLGIWLSQYKFLINESYKENVLLKIIGRCSVSYLGRFKRFKRVTRLVLLKKATWKCRIGFRTQKYCIQLVLHDSSFFANCVAVVENEPLQVSGDMFMLHVAMSNCNSYFCYTVKFSWQLVLQWCWIFPISHFQNTSDLEFLKRGNKCRSGN